MAGTALVGGGDVLGRLCRRPYRAGVAMAAGTVARRGGGNALLVAAVAARAGVCTFQPEAGTEVIKLRAQR